MELFQLSHHSSVVNRPFPACDESWHSLGSAAAEQVEQCRALQEAELVLLWGVAGHGPAAGPRSARSRTQLPALPARHGEAFWSGMGHPFPFSFIIRPTNLVNINFIVHSRSLFCNYDRFYPLKQKVN